MNISDLARRWIAANFLTMVATAAFGLLGFGIRYLLDVESADAAPSAKFWYVAAEIIMTAAAMALYAQLTGAVLRRIAPVFPGRCWLAIHLAIGLVVGTGMGALLAEPGDSEPIDWNETGLPAIAFTFAFVTVIGVVLGTIMGGLQALVLRRVVDGTGAWIAFSALATGTALLAVASVFQFLPTQQTFATEAVTESVIVLAAVVSAIVMLPALRRLRPRTTEG